MVAAGADRVQSMPVNMVSKYVMSSFGIEILINRITVNNQQEKQIMLQVVQKISYLLEGNLMASERTLKCLQSHQSARMGLSTKDHSTIQCCRSLKQGEHMHSMNSVLTSFFDHLHP